MSIYSNDDIQLLSYLPLNRKEFYKRVDEIMKEYDRKTQEDNSTIAHYTSTMQNDYYKIEKHHIMFDLVDIYFYKATTKNGYEFDKGITVYNLFNH